MSTDNFKNNASQTLFRFVSLRNPQLTETKRRNLGFIHRPSGARGIFDTAVENRRSGTLKLNALSAKISEFSLSAIKSEKELEEGVYGQLLAIGRKISRKEAVADHEMAYTKGYYSNHIDANKELTSDGVKLFEHLWSNLIYQVVSQKDFYVKEAISHILKAIHLGFAQHMDLNDQEIKKVNGNKPLENALRGKIVMPKSLFVEDDSQSGSSLLSRTSSGIDLSAMTQQRLKSKTETNTILNSVLKRKDDLQKLSSELEKLQKSYYKSSYKAYQDLHTRYLEENRERLQQYEILSEELARLVELKTPEEELRRFYEQLKEIEVAPFEFSYKSEIDIAELQNKLSPESFDLFLELFF